MLQWGILNKKIQNNTPKPFLFLYEKTKHEAQITTKPHFGVWKKMWRHRA